MTKIALKTLAGAASALFLLGIHTVNAGTEKLRSEAYFNAISGGNPETITSFYADNAEFHWVGGPLAGVYTGKAQIKGVWERFIKAAGDIDHKVLELTESQKGKLSTVMARVNFIGPAEVPVRFTMVYENGKIVNEIWEVDKPTIGVVRTDVKPEAPAQTEEQATAEVKPDEPAKIEAKPQAFAKADSITPTLGESGKESTAIQPPAPEKREGAADAGKDAGTPPLPESKSASADDEAKASGVKGTPTPLPPSFSNAPAKKSASKPSAAPKKQKDTARNDGPKKKKSSSEYAQRDDDGDDDYGYNRYSDYDDYDRRPYYSYYRPYYGPSFRFRFGNSGYGYRNYNRYGYYGYGRY